MLKQAIVASIVRRLIGYLGVAGVAGIDNDLIQVGGAFAAAASLAWSLWEKVRAARNTK